MLGSWKPHTGTAGIDGHVRTVMCAVCARCVDIKFYSSAARQSGT